MKLTTLVAVLCSVAAADLPAQRPRPVASRAAVRSPAVRPKYKAIWEPINYKQDLKLTDVYFVNDKVGWVTGEAGTILHTEDGGDTWTAELGGDPGATADPICCVKLVDATHGWAISGYSALLRTTDGRTWEQTGAEVRADGTYQFLSDADGFYAYGDGISRTQDGGRTWKRVYQCHASMEVDGLTRQVGCTVFSLSFPSSTVGYAGRDARITVKTVDGGATWNALVGPAEPGDQRVDGLFFTDERTGFAVRPGPALYRTDDGGQTWKGVVASPGRVIRFAGHDVGWSFNGRLMSYTTDGGKRWTARQIRFPVDVNAFALPSPERGYVVGDHGMIYRYRIVPITYTAKGMIDAPMMPAGTP